MSIRLRNKYGLLLLTLCALMFFVGEANARGYKTHAVRHYMALSFGGGEANNMSGEKGMRPIAGGAGNIMLSYEAHIKRAIIMLGLQFQYQYTRDTLAPFKDAFDRNDIMGAVNYRYMWSSWQEKEHDMRITIPIRVGYQTGDYFYFLVGADVSIPMKANYTTSSRMFTEGLHAWDAKPIRTDEVHDFTRSLGYWPTADYSTTNTCKDSWWIAPSLELGTYIPLPSRKLKMRAGVYVNYGIRMSKKNQTTAVDYTGVNMEVNPNTQSTDVLQNAIRLNSSVERTMPGNLEAGVRLTLLMDVTTQKKICRCMEY